MHLNVFIFDGFLLPELCAQRHWGTGGTGQNIYKCAYAHMGCVCSGNMSTSSGRKVMCPCILLTMQYRYNWTVTVFCRHILSLVKSLRR